MTDISYTESIIVSILFLIILLVFYLYKHNNKFILKILSANYYKYKPVEIKKDTRLQDWIIFILILIAVITIGMKMISFTVVISDSMKPTFQKGDMILTQSMFLDTKPGDIITFHVEGQVSDAPESHRIVMIKNGLIVTKGDAYNINDAFHTTQKDVIAKTVEIFNHPIVIKGIGELFITDYSKEGVIYKWGDRFTFLQQLSATLKAWGLVITIISLCAYLISMRKT
jgi:signal peptidase